MISPVPSSTAYREYKYLLPREHGYWQDVDQYYSRPPRLLVLPFLTGTREQIVQQFNFFTAVSLASEYSRTFQTQLMFPCGQSSLVT